MIAKTARWIAIGALFLIPFLPLIVANSLFFPFITGKGFAFRILVEIAFAAWVVLALADKKYRPHFSWTFVLYGALVLWMVIADALAINPFKAFWSNYERMDGWITLIHLFVFFIVSGSILSVEKLWRKWWMVFLGVSALICAYGVLQIAGLTAIHQGGVRVDATLGNAAYLAAYLLFAIAVSLWQTIESKGWLRYTLGALTVLQIVILFYTETRGAILGALGAAVLGSILWMIEAGKKSRRAAGVLLLVLALLAGGFFLVRHDAWVQKLPALGRLSTISVAEGAPRFAIWNMALHGFAERPITGWGQEGFNYVFNKYYEPSMYTQEPWFDRAHDVFLDWLIAGGAPALLLFLALLASAVVAFYRGSASRAERVMLTGALAAYAFQGIFVFDNLLTYVPLAALLALAHTATARPLKMMEDAPAFSESSLQTVGSVAFVCAVVVIWFVNVNSMRAATDLIKAFSAQSDPQMNLNYLKQALADDSFAAQEIREQIVSIASGVANQPTVSDTTKAAFAQLAVTQMGQQIAETPKDARLRLEYAYAYRAAGDATNSLKQFDAALALSPKKQTLIIQKGVVEWEAGDTAAARDLFNQAYQLDTSMDDVAAYAAAGDIVTGDLVNGQALLVQHFGTTTVDNDYVLLAYYQTRQWNSVISIYELRVAKADGSADSRFRLAYALALAGRLADARAEVRAAIAAHPEAAGDGAALLTQLDRMGQ